MKLDNFQNATPGNWSTMLGATIGGIATIPLSAAMYTSNISLPPGFLLFQLSAMFMHFGGNKVQDCTNGWSIRSSSAPPAWCSSSQGFPTYATQRMPLQISFFLICTIDCTCMVLGLCTGSRTLYECAARTPASYVTRYAQNVDRCRYFRSVRPVWILNRTRYAISGKRTRSNQHGCHPHQRTHPGAGHPLLGRKWQDGHSMPAWFGRRDICACRAVSPKRKTLS